MTDPQAAWLAGFIDGEGSLMISRRSRSKCTEWSALLAVSNTDMRLIDRCRLLASGGVIAHVDMTNRGNAKDAYIWTLKGPRLTAVLDAILPHLVAKRRQAELLIEIRRGTRNGARRGRPWGQGTVLSEAQQARRQEIRDEVRRLNQRGRGAAKPDYCRMAARRTAQLGLL